MAKPNKKAEWYRFGRSGDTIDGRVIKVEDIQQAADSYDMNFYTALIWPDHKRWFNLGKVIAVRAEKNDEGGMDLYGQVEANEYYKDMNKMGQRLFFSMELWPNFRKTDKTYLSGLAATDEPASVATSEIHLSRVEPDVTVGDAIEAVPHYFEAQGCDEKTLLAAIASFFKSQTPSDDDSDDSQEETDMTKEQYEALSSGLTALTQRFNKAFPEGDQSNEQAEGQSDKNTLADQVVALSQQVKDLTEKLNKGADTPPKEAASKEEFASLKTALDDLTQKFKAALSEQEGTDGGEHDGDGKDLSACI